MKKLVYCGQSISFCARVGASVLLKNEEVCLLQAIHIRLSWARARTKMDRPQQTSKFARTGSTGMVLLILAVLSTPTCDFKWKFQLAISWLLYFCCSLFLLLMLDFFFFLWVSYHFCSFVSISFSYVLLFKYHTHTLSLTHTHTLMHSCTQPYTHTHTHKPKHFLPLSLSLLFSLLFPVFLIFYHQRCHVKTFE